MRFVLVDFGERHDTQPNGQHYTAADRGPTNQVSCTGKSPDTPKMRDIRRRISGVSGMSARMLRGNCFRGISASPLFSETHQTPICVGLVIINHHQQQQHCIIIRQTFVVHAPVSIRTLSMQPRNYFLERNAFPSTVQNRSASHIAAVVSQMTQSTLPGMGHTDRQTGRSQHCLIPPTVWWWHNNLVLMHIILTNV